MPSLNRSYSTPSEPFGPANADDISFNDTRTHGSLFETNNWMKDKFRGNPTIIVGRRGSGKTHYLHNVVFDQQYDYYVEIRTSRVLRYVARIVQGISEDIIFPETIAEVWETILWVAIFSEIRKHSLLSVDDLALIETYLGNVGVRENDNVDKALLAVANTLSEEMNRKHDVTISKPIRNFENITFHDAKTAVLRNLESSKRNFVILIDSMDDFQLDILLVERALQSLLMVVGSMNKPRDVVDIRFCLPSELYQRFIKLSLSPSKDFRRALILQWDERELVLIGAQRLTSYLTSHYPEFYKKFNSLNLATYVDALTLFNAVLPKHINNPSGYPEETLFYILRHTQLLPRQFLILLNSIFRNPDSGQRANPFPVSEERIVNGVRQMEDLVMREIFAAFKLIYPTAEETCRHCLPKLGNKFTMATLKRVFTDRGKVVFGNDNFFEFQRMLLEIGAIGRVIPDPKRNVYIMGDFEYVTLGQLFFSKNSELCIHPLFSSIFRSSGKQERLVYPYGRIDVNETYLPQNLSPKKTSTNIFVSYRRSDSADVAGRIYDRLVQSFGKESIFKDVDTIPVGLDFRDVLDDAVKNCDIFLVIIGNQWLELKNADGNRRIDDPKDFVRTEIEFALKRRIPVIPILVQGADMPPPNRLPRVIKELAYRNGLQVRPDPDFHKDMDRLISKLPFPS